MNSRPGYLRAPVIAVRLGVSVRTVRRWIADGTLPSTKVRGTRLVAEDDLARVLCGGGTDLAADIEGFTAQQYHSVT